jgi:hypothetical protein
VAAKVVTLCDSVVTFLNGLTLVEPYTAVRQNVLMDQLEQITGLSVFVLPVESELTQETREDRQRLLRVATIVQDRLPGTLTEQRDRGDVLLELTEQIEDALYQEAMGDFEFFAFGETTGSRTLVDLDSASARGLFRTVVETTYRE